MPDPHDEDKIAGAPPANLDNSTILPAAGSVPWPPLVLFGLLQRLFGPPSARSIVGAVRATSSVLRRSIPADSRGAKEDGPI
jgi:hypothetical protein